MSLAETIERLLQLKQMFAQVFTIRQRQRALSRRSVLCNTFQMT